MLGDCLLRGGEPTFLRLGNMWLTTNGEGGPTDDKPEVVASPTRDRNVLSIFLNLRVTGIKHYHELPARGAKFITEPKVDATELRCHMDDPDGYLIEVGQTTMTASPLELYD
jgi:lactoylglutathione lyase